jgi:hypothetical protein
MESFVVSAMSCSPRIIGRGTAHAAMIFTELLRQEQYEMQRAALASSSSCSRATHRRTSSNSEPFIGASTGSPRAHTHSPRTRTSPQLENNRRFWRDSRVRQNGSGARTPIQLSDSEGSDASSPSESPGVPGGRGLSLEELMAARSELTRQMEHKKAAHEVLMKEMQQLQDRISMLETSAPTADRLLCSSPRRARPVATATTATATTATATMVAATMVTSTMVTATMRVRSPDEGDGSPDVDDDVARMPAGALPRCRSREKELARASSRTVSKVLTGLTDLAVTLAQARPKAGSHVDGHTPSSVMDTNTVSLAPCS